jgi:hypothetical protein
MFPGVVVVIMFQGELTISVRHKKYFAEANQFTQECWFLS